MVSPNIARDCLENCCQDNVRGDFLIVESRQAYARGIINGMVSMLMAVSGLEFLPALAIVKQLSRSDAGRHGTFDLVSIPDCWRDDWDRV